MRVKSVKFLGLTLLLSLLLSVGFVCVPKKQIYANAEAGQTYTNYMLIDGNVNQVTSETKAGTLLINETEVQDGNSYKFVLGEENVNIVASANQGYVLKGWYILYEDDSLGNISGTNNGYIAITETQQSINNNLLTINNFTIQDKQASLVIAEVFENIKIAPVYDYEYFNVELTDATETHTIGSYKFGDTVSIDKAVDENVNIDATGFTFSNKNIEFTHTFTKDETTLKTTNYQLNFEMNVYDDVEINLNYDNLYKIDFKLYLNNTDSALEETSQGYSSILENLKIKADKVWNSDQQKYVDRNRYFSKLSDASYFVKTDSNFEVSVSNNIKNENGYIIYNFVSLDGNTSVTENYNGINTDKTVKVVYDYKSYNVEFVGVENLNEQGNIKVDSSLTVPENTSYTVVDSTITLTEVANVGYNFLGFAKYVANKDKYTSDDFIEEVSLDTDYPEDLKIYAIYQKIGYTINIGGLTSVSLTNLGSETVYPIASAELNGNTKTGTTISYSPFYIGDSLTLKLSLNNGFVVNSISDMTKLETDEVYTLVLDKNFLNGKTEEIELTINASTQKYTLTYRIDKLTNSSDNSKYRMAEIKIGENSPTTSDEIDYYEIVVSDLTYYQTLTLTSTANQTSTAGEYYVFKWFTTDFKTTLSGVTSNNGTPPTMSVNFTIYGDSVVYVVYTQPTTQLQIQIDSAPDDAGILFAVSQVDTEGYLQQVNNLYSLNQNKLVTISISNLENNANLFGYKFVNVTLYTLGNDSNLNIVENSESTSTSIFTFTPTNSDTYVVVVKIEKINYVFNITSNLDFSISKTLTVENSLIEFTKPVGYYVNNVQFKGSDNNYVNYPSMAQNNSSRNGQFVDGKNLFTDYFYTISTVKENGAASEFENIISTYGIENGSNINVDIFLSFSIYTYEIKVKYYKFHDNSVDTANGIKLTYPTIELNYSLADGTTGVASQENLSGEILYKYIPYSANVSLSVVKAASYGFKMAGWYDYDCQNKKTDNLYTFNLNGINQDDRFAYRVDFETYQISLSFNEDMGAAKINESLFANVKMGDSVNIKANPSTSKGFITNSIKTTKNVYTAYQFTTQEQFSLDYNNLVIIKDGYIFPVISSEYNENDSYYTISTTQYELKSDTFTVDSFDVGEYYVDTNNTITFEISYVPVEMKIVNNTTLIAKLGEDDQIVCDVLDLSKIGLTIDQVASYSVKALKAGVYRDVVENETLVTVDDVIIVDIQINETAQNTDGKVFNLAKGLELNLNPLYDIWSGLTCDHNGNGSYRISFAVAQNIKTTFVENGIIEMNYSFQQQELKKVTALTNMSGFDSFYKNTELGITVDTVETNSNQVGSISKEYNFLSKVNVDLDLKNLNDYFVINSVTVYAESVSTDNIIADFEKYYITPNYTTQPNSDRRIITNVDFILMDIDIIIQFNVQPRMYLDGTEITTQQEYVFNRTYKIDDNGVGVAQTFTLGENKTNNIAGYQINNSTMKLEIYKNGIPQAAAIDVGEYTLKLALIDNTNSDSWLYYINDLPFSMKLKITPLAITLNATVNNAIVKEYYASSTYANFSLVIDGGKLKSSDGLIEINGVANQKVFNLGVLNFNYGYTAEIVLYGEDGGLVSQKNVTNGNAHLLITNLQINNNPNFNLMLSKYNLNSSEVSGLLIESCIQIIPKVVHIENLDVYNKVWNGESNANFGLTEGATKYIVGSVYLADDVYINVEELKVYFTTRKITKTDNLDDIKTSDIGENRYVVIDARTALAGNQKNNYVIGNDRTGFVNYGTKTIYPYTLTTTVKGVGNVTITNKRGLTDHTKANLIPVNATLSAERFNVDSSMYREIHGNISSFLSRRNVFVAGYKLSVIDRNGAKTNVSNELYLTLPNEEELKQVLSLTGDRTVVVNYDEKGGNIEIDLKQINEDINYFVLIQNRALLQTWQIVLIVVLSVGALAGVGVAVFFILRKRKLRNDKYDTI